MSELTGSGFLAGASGATVNEMIQDKLSDMFKDDPAMHQWASALIGGVVSEIVTGNAQAGASTAASATKNNLFWEHVPEFRESIKNVDVSNLPEGYCQILSFSGSVGELASANISDAALVFNTPGNDVFSSTDITVAVGVGTPFGMQVGVGWLEDTNGNIVTDPSIIQEQMKGISLTVSGSAGANVTVYNAGNGYVFKTKGFGSSVSLTFGGSYTKYLGYKEDVAKGIFK